MQERKLSCMHESEPILCLCKYYEMCKGIRIADFDEESLIQFWSDQFEIDNSRGNISDIAGPWPFLSGDASVPTEYEKERLKLLSRKDLIESVYSFFEFKRSSNFGKQLFTERNLENLLTSTKLAMVRPPKTPLKSREKATAHRTTTHANNDTLKIVPSYSPKTERKEFSPSRLVHSQSMYISVKKGKLALIESHFKRKEWDICRRLFSENFQWLYDPNIVPGMPAILSSQVRDIFERFTASSQVKPRNGVRENAPSKSLFEMKENVSPKSEQLNESKIYTRRMCLEWLEFGICKQGDRCHLAHSLKDRYII